jgi:hypothetical protein
MVGLTNQTSADINNEKCSLLAEKLRASLKSAVLTPDSEGYQQSIIRWSDAMEKRAVSR